MHYYSVVLTCVNILRKLIIRHYIGDFDLIFQNCLAKNRVSRVKLVMCRATRALAFLALERVESSQGLTRSD